MQMGFELEQSQKLTQKLSQKMVQAINILQMNTETLEQFMMEAYMNNPVLEIKKTNVSEPDWKQYSKHRMQNFNRHEPNDHDMPNDDWSLGSVGECTYIEDLLMQWHAKKLGQPYESMGEWLINHIDARGYLDEDIIDKDNLSDTMREQIEYIIEQIQELEPAGIGCRTLEERLIVQLRRKGQETPQLEKLINHYLEELGDRKWQQICKKLKITLEELKEYINIVRNLDPILNVGCNHRKVCYVKPQVRVVDMDGKLEVEYVEEKALSLFIPEYYYGLLGDDRTEESTRTYIKQKMDQATWLFRNIEERKQNLMKIASCILEKQQDFIKYGKSYMKSMTQKEVAHELDISVSTVSRIVNGKYMDTPRGMFELKYFFSSGIDTNQEDISAIAIKSKIRELIDGENKKRPLSDEKIKKCLEEWDIEVSRRTVAKYRTGLNIPNASKRKEL